ncbi:MAG TPA: 2-phospho-L-lactate transferase [Solirubrobacterales bacterium]|nr:2-phospho-L-lactate transferase [Solirubrobacterales bacterium]
MSDIERCVVLAGGTGGAKLAAGLQDVLGEGLSVIANTADDVEMLGCDVSPDPDLVTYWLSGDIDERKGWGLKDDTEVVFERLKALGAPDWFQLSDKDIATCLYRRAFVAEGGTRAGAQAQIARALGVRARVLPMCEEPVRTRVRTADGWRWLQEYLIVEGGRPAVEGVELAGIAEATAAPEVLAAIDTAQVILIGPSNPVISIGPILATPGIREAIIASPAPVVAVSPYVGGEVVKGPTDAFVRGVGRPATAAGVASLYAGLLDGMVCDEGDPDPAPEGLEILTCPTLMEGAEGRRALAERALGFASSLRAPV